MVTDTNAEWLKRAEVIAGATLAGFRLPAEVEFVVDRAVGSHIWDVDGKEYTDFVLGSGPMILGHAHPAVVTAVQETLPLGSTYYALNRFAIELAEEITDAVACAERIKFMSTGAEATMYAMRLARAFTGRSKILKFEGGYHGSHDAAMMSVAPAAAGSGSEPVPDSAGIPEGVRGDILIAPYNDDELTEVVARTHQDDLAAIIVEPQQRTIPPKPDFLRALRQIADDVGALLIFDEVVTGFRLAYGGAQAFYGVTPDLATYGKIIGGGFPMSAIAGQADILDLSDTRRKGDPSYVHISGTLSGNPIAAVAGLATLAQLREPGVYERLAGVGERLRSGLAAAATKHKVPVQVIGEGPLVATHFTDQPIVSYRDVLTGDRNLMTRVNTGLVKRGMLVQLASKFYLSLAHTDEDIDNCVRAFDEALFEACS